MAQELPSEEALLRRYLTTDLLPTSPEGTTSLRRVSTLLALLRDARGVTGRDLRSGEVIPGEDEHSHFWLGAVAYLVLLAQLGSAAVPVWGNATNEPLLDCLRHFTDVDDGDAEILKELRNRLVHEYGLGTGDPNLVLTADPGTWLTSEADRHTEVNLRRLGDLTTQAIGRAREELNAGKLRINPKVPGGGDPRADFARRRFFWVSLP